MKKIGATNWLGPPLAIRVVIGYTYHVIGSFRHKGLKQLYSKGDRRKVSPENADKIERILARLDQACEPSDMDLPGYRLHALKGDLEGFWAVTVSGNWRIIFRFEGGHALDVDLLDYH